MQDKLRPAKRLDIAATLCAPREHPHSMQMQRCSILTMRFKATLASLLAVLLVSVSCVASACEVSCDLKTRVACCHSGSAAQTHSGRSDAQMATMKHCAMTASDRSTQPPNSATVEAFQSCQHCVCSQQPALPNEVVAAAHPIVSQNAATSMLPFVSPAGSSQVLTSAAPPRRTSSLVSLYTILRV